MLTQLQFKVRDNLKYGAQADLWTPPQYFGTFQVITAPLKQTTLSGHGTLINSPTPPFYLVQTKITIKLIPSQQDYTTLTAARPQPSWPSGSE